MVSLRFSMDFGWFYLDLQCLAFGVQWISSGVPSGVFRCSFGFRQISDSFSSFQSVSKGFPLAFIGFPMFVQFSWTSFGFPGVFNGFPLVSLSLSMGFQWVSMGFQGFQWLSIGVPLVLNRFPLTLNAFPVDLNGCALDFLCFSMDFH